MIVDWDQKIIQLFADFADEDMQRRSWFGIGPEVSSPIEMCNWPDDIFVEEWIDKNRKNLGIHLEEFMRDFLKDIDRLADLEESWSVFSSIEWIQVRLKASVVRDVLLKRLE